MYTARDGGWKADHYTWQSNVSHHDLFQDIISATICYDMTQNGEV